MIQRGKGEGRERVRRKGRRERRSQKGKGEGRERVRKEREKGEKESERKGRQESGSTIAGDSF